MSVPVENKSPWKRSKPKLRFTGTFIHLSKELVAVPDMALGVDGKPKPTGNFHYEVAESGTQYKRPTPKVRARRRNAWGAEPYYAARERAIATQSQQKKAAEWKALQGQSVA